MRKSGSTEGQSASELIDKRIAELGDWRGETLSRMRKLFNASLDGNARRAIDIHEGEEVDAGAFKELIRAAVALNTSGAKARPRRAK